MSKIKILAPVNSYKAMKLQAEAGADEVYVGFTSQPLAKSKGLFNARNESYADVKHQTQVSSEDELRQIVDFAHSCGIKVHYCANVPALREPLKEHYLRYVEIGISAGVDSIIVGCVGAIIFLREVGIKIPITAGSFLHTFNTEQIDFLKELGVSRVILPQDLTISEIKQLVSAAQERNIEVEVFGHLGAGNICGRCMMFHSTVTHELPCGCRCAYTVSGPEHKVNKYLFFGSHKDCGICSLPHLIDAGVYAIKLIGREIEPEIMSNITRIYRYVIDALYNGKTINDILREFSSQPWWHSVWVPLYCEQKSCKYIYL